MRVSWKIQKQKGLRLPKNGIQGKPCRRYQSTDGTEGPKISDNIDKKKKEDVQGYLWSLDSSSGDVKCQDFKTFCGRVLRVMEEFESL